MVIRDSPCSPAVSSFVNTCVRALCLASSLFAWATAAHAQAPGGPSSDVPTVAANGTQAGRSQPHENLSRLKRATPVAGETSASRGPMELTFDEKPEAPPAPVARSGWSPTVFWIAASATIITASLGGFEALHVRDLYDQAQGIPAVSPQREPLHREMRTAEVTADALLIGSLVLAVGTTILAFNIDWSGSDRPKEQLAARVLPQAVAGGVRRQLPPLAAGRRWW